MKRIPLPRPLLKKHLLHFTLVFLFHIIHTHKISTLQAQSFCPDDVGTSCAVCPPYTVDPNPDLILGCEDELNIALVLDESGSISGVEDEVEDAVLALLNGLSCFDVNIVIIEFDQTASYVISTYTQLDGALVSDVQGYFNGTPLNGQTFVPGGVTNWQDAMILVDNVTPPPDLLYFISDGFPNTINGPGAGVTQCFGGDGPIFNPVQVANIIKGEGTHIFGIAIGPNAPTTITDISGPTQYMGNTAPGCQVCTDDFAVSNDVDASLFEGVAEDLCDCDDMDCNTMDSYDSAICACVNTAIPPPNCDDGDCSNGIETYNSNTCMCDPGTPPDMNCDDGDCNNGVETYNPVTCMCDPGIPPNMDCDDGDCNNGVETYNSNTCMCDPGTPPNMDCDDGNCSNGIETYNSVTCVCETSPPPNPDPSFSCADGNACGMGTEIMLNAIDLGTNGTNVSTGTWSGNAAVLVNDNGTPNDITDDYLVPNSSFVGMQLTLILTMNNNGCIVSTECTFRLIINTSANAGSLNGGN